MGGKAIHPDWKILNALEAPGVDFLGDIMDLSPFPDACCESVYASHILEHVNQSKMINTLKEIRRLLIPGGTLMISVPNLTVLSELFIDPDLDFKQKFHVMRMMFGGQIDSYDFHYIGLSYEILSDYLNKAGFQKIQRVEKFDIFKDTNAYAPYKGKLISLNLIATND